MKKIEQNISELNVFWKKTLKKLSSLIKPLQIISLLINETRIVEISDGKIFLNCDNESLKKIIKNNSEKILMQFKSISEMQNINEIIFDSNIKTVKNEEIANISNKEKFNWLYFNADESLKKIENFILNKNAKKNVLIIQGEKNSGKSFLLEQILRFIRFFKNKGNIFTLSTFSYLINIDMNVVDNFFLYDNIESLPNNKIDELFKVMANKRNFFILSTSLTDFIDNKIFKKIDNKSVDIVNLNVIDNDSIDKIIKSRIKFTIYPTSYSLLISYLKNNPKDIDNLLSTINLFYKQNDEKIVYKRDIDNVLKMLNIDTTSVDVEKVLKTVAQKLDLRVADLLSQSRKRKYIVARSLVAYVLRNKYKLSLKEIGYKLNKKSHSTIINLLDFYNNRLIDNVEISNIYNIFI